MVRLLRLAYDNSSLMAIASSKLYTLSTFLTFFMKTTRKIAIEIKMREIAIKEIPMIRTIYPPGVKPIYFLNLSRTDIIIRHSIEQIRTAI